MSSEAQAFFEDGRQLLAKGKVRAAVIQLKNALQRDPDHARARQLLGMAYLRLGDGASAEKELGRALDLGIARGEIASELARARLLLGEFQQLLDDLPLPTNDDPLFAEALLLRGDAHLGLGNPASARQSYGRAARELPNDVRPLLGLARAALAEARRDEAERHVETALALDPGSWHALMLKGELRRTAGDFEAARKSFAAAVDQAPDHPLSRLGLASAEIALGLDSEAEKSLSPVEKLVPRHPIAGFLKAVILMRKAEPEAALARLEEVGSAVEQYLPALVLRGAIRYRQNQLEQAITDLGIVVNRMAQHLPSRKLLAAAYLKLAKPAQAIALLEQAGAEALDDPQVNALLGTAYLQAGDTAEGVARMERAIAAAPDQPDLLRQLAIGSLATGDVTRAISALRSSLDLGADRVSTGLLLGLAELNAGHTDAALKAARDLQSAAPESPVGWNLAGGALMALGELDQAREAFQGALDAEQAFLPARFNLAQLALQQGDSARAGEQFREILKRDASNVRAQLGLARVVIAAGDRGGALALLDKARQVQLESAPEGLLETASLYEAVGAAETALETLESAVRQSPRSPQLLRALARMRLARGNPGAAVVVFEKLVALAPESAPLFVELGQAQLQADRLVEAGAPLRRAIEIDPDLTAAYITLAQVEMRRNGLDAGLSVVEELRAREPQAADADLLAGDLFRLDGKPHQALEAYEAGWRRKQIRGLAFGRFQSLWQLGEHSAAVAALREWLATSPEDDALRMQLAGSLLQMGEQAAAIEEYETLQERQPNNPILLNNLAYLYLDDNDGRALMMARRAHLLAPDSPEIMDTLGWTLVQTDAVEEALEILEHATQMRPDQLDIGYHLAFALHKAGRTEEARSRLAALLEDGRAFASRGDAESLLRQLSSP